MSRGREREVEQPGDTHLEVGHGKTFWAQLVGHTGTSSPGLSRQKTPAAWSSWVIRRSLHSVATGFILLPLASGYLGSCLTVPRWSYPFAIAVSCPWGTWSPLWTGASLLLFKAWHMCLPLKTPWTLPGQWAGQCIL